MNDLRATYRLQFRNGMTFQRAAELVPYLTDLGISHLYASPIFRAALGSTHGYDVADHQELEPELGGSAGFSRLAEALQQHGLGLMLDIVPNHMAVSTANPWWRDVLQFGQNSRYANHFDIDWRARRLLLPLLGEPYGEALEEDKFELALEDGAVTFRYYELSLPLAPGTLEAVAGKAGDAEQLAEAVRGDRERLHRLHEKQVWQLAYWRLAREALPYRRFFEIADLVGVRVEDPAVFAQVHALPLQLLREGKLDLLRIDHIDGLADPAGYLERLKIESGGAGVLVEKILGPDEELPGDWACLGTTGYEIAELITALQVERQNEAEISAAWHSFTGAAVDYEELVKSCKHHILVNNLAGELAALVRMALELAAGSLKHRDIGPDSLRLALVELAVALPVYRTYIDRAGATARDAELLKAAAEAARGERRLEDATALDFLLQLLLEPAAGDEARLTFIQRFQQTTGPLTAKAVEDTAFYRFNRLIALNEVGGEPGRFGIAQPDFHAAMGRRAEKWPSSLSATATHDTKRGEDARARLTVLSEMPREWRAAVESWHRQLADIEEEVTAAVHREDAWLFYQALAGAWPGDLLLDNEEGLQDLAERLAAFMTKALREAKERSSWTAPDAAYEDKVERFVCCLFKPSSRPLLRQIRAMITRLEPAGLVNALAQVTLKMTLPGVPDVYQGSELPDHSLVDPDNRRAVDFARRRQLLEKVKDLPAHQVMRDWRAGLPKFWLTHRLLAARRQHAEIFARGTYEPLVVEGDEADHVLAFARVLDKGPRIIVAVPLRVSRHLDPWSPSWLAEAFAQTYLKLEGGPFTGIDGATVQGTQLSLGRLWKNLPIAVLCSHP